MNHFCRRCTLMPNLSAIFIQFLVTFFISIAHSLPKLTCEICFRMSQKLLRVLRSQDPLHRQLQVHGLQEPGGRPRRCASHQEGAGRDVNNVDGDVIDHDGGDGSTNPESSKPQGEVGTLHRQWVVQAARGHQVSQSSQFIYCRIIGFLLLWCG